MNSYSNKRQIKIMAKVATFSVQLQLADKPTIDVEALRTAISESIGNTMHEGDLCSETASAVTGWTVAHVCTSTEGDSADQEALDAILALRSKGYAVVAFSPKQLGSMAQEEMQPFLEKMGLEAIEESADEDEV